MKEHGILGIDNGLSGGMCYLSPHGKIIGLASFPIMKNERQVDSLKLYGSIQQITCGHPFHAVIEACPDHADRTSTMRSMALNFGKTRATLELMFPDCLTINTVRSGNPKDSWQRKLLGRGVDTKPAALAKAKELWPDETWLRTEKCTKPDTGFIDAALIAHFWRTK